MPACHVKVFALVWRLDCRRTAPLHNERETHKEAAREGGEERGVMQGSIRVRKPGWMVHVQKGQGGGVVQQWMVGWK